MFPTSFDMSTGITTIDEKASVIFAAMHDGICGIWVERNKEIVIAELLYYGLFVDGAYRFSTVNSPDVTYTAYSDDEYPNVDNGSGPA